MSLLNVENLSIAYGTQAALRQVSFHLAPGETLGIVGESGSGKSTLLRALSGLLESNACITNGHIIFQGQELTHCSENQLKALRGSVIGMIFQNASASFCPVRTIGDQVHETLAAHRLCTRAESDAAAAEIFAHLGLEEPQRILAAYPYSLSGGMSQRVAIALAMLLQPSLLLADEPTSALDVLGQRQILDELALLRQLCGAAIILVTHNIGHCEWFADKVLVLRDGCVVEYGPTAQVLNAPQSKDTKELLAAVPRLRRG